MSEHELWNELGNLYFMSGAYDQASYAYQRSIQMDPGFGRPYSNLAVTYVQQGKYDEAIDLYRTSIELLAANRKKQFLWNRLGTVYRHLKDYSKAVIAFQEADLTGSAEHHGIPGRPRCPPAARAQNLPGLECRAACRGSKSRQSLKRPGGCDREPHNRSPAGGEHWISVTGGRSASWTPSDLSQYQQDILEMPENRSAYNLGLSPPGWW